MYGDSAAKLSSFISLYLLLSTRQAELAKIEFNPLIFKNNDEKNKKGLEAWQEEIKEIDLQIREHQTVINQLRERKQKLIAAHRKKRKPAWDSETPLYRLVNLQQYASGCVPCDESYITKKLPESLEISKIVPIFATSEHMFWLSGQNPEVAGHLKFHDRSKTSR